MTTGACTRVALNRKSSTWLTACRSQTICPLSFQRALMRVPYARSKFFRLDYQFDQNNSLRGTFTFGGSNFQVPNRLEQELAGQNVRQRLRDNSQNITFQHIFSPNAVGQISI